MSTLIKKEAKFQFAQQISVKAVEMAFNSTFVVLYHQIQNPNESCIVHLGENIKEEHKFKQYVNQMVMINPEELVFPLKSENKLVMMNLKENKNRSIDFHFLFFPHSFELFFFKTTNLVCIKEIRREEEEVNSDSDDNQEPPVSKWSDLNLTYIDAQLRDKPIMSWKLTQVKQHSLFQNCGCWVYKANNNSLLVFEKNDISQIVLFDLQRVEEKTQARIRTFQLPQLQMYRQISWYYWQFYRDSLFCINTSTKEAFLGMLYLEKGKIQQQKPDIQWPAHLSSCKAIFLDGYILITKKNHQSDVKKNITQYLIGLGWDRLYLAYKLPHDNGIDTITNVCSHDMTTIVKHEMDNVNKTLKINLIKTIIEKQIYMFMLLHIQEDLDDDLLLDCLRLLVDI